MQSTDLHRSNVKNSMFRMLIEHFLCQLWGGSNKTTVYTVCQKMASTLLW